MCFFYRRNGIMPIKNIRLILVLLGCVIAYGQVCTAGTWVDDFSDRTLRDWGFIEKNDDWIAIVNNERFNFRGKNEDANFALINWELGEIQDFSLELQVMFMNIRDKSFWRITYVAQPNLMEEPGGFVDFTFDFGFGHRMLDPGTARVDIAASVPEEHPQFGVILRPVIIAEDRFEYEKGVWYTLKIERVGNRYTFSIDGVVLEAAVDSVPIGWIGFRFYGRLSLVLDNFIVTGPNVPNGGPGGLLAVKPAEKLATMWGKLKVRD